MFPTLSSGVDDNQLWDVGRVAERLPKRRYAVLVLLAVPGLITEPLWVTFGRTNKEVIAAIQVHVAQACHVVAHAGRLDIPVSRMPRPGSVVWVPCVCGLNPFESAMNGSCPPMV